MSCQCRLPQCVTNRLNHILQCLRCNHCCNGSVRNDNDPTDDFTVEADVVRDVLHSNSNQRNITEKNTNLSPPGQFTDLEDGRKNDLNHDSLLFDNIEIGDLSYRAMTDGYDSPDQNDFFDSSFKNTIEDDVNDVIIDSQ